MTEKLINDEKKLEIIENAIEKCELLKDKMSLVSDDHIPVELQEPIYTILFLSQKLEGHELELSMQIEGHELVKIKNELFKGQNQLQELNQSELINLVDPVIVRKLDDKQTLDYSTRLVQMAKDNHIDFEPMKQS